MHSNVASTSAEDQPTKLPLVLKTGRIVYVEKCSRSSNWLPGPTEWRCSFGLPYGWEMAVDERDMAYYLNHETKLSTYNDPRLSKGDDSGGGRADSRRLTLERRSNLGFGFVAGSENPVIVRYVTEGGPSWGKLLVGDEILSVNGEWVAEQSKSYVVALIRGCDERLQLLVCQPAPYAAVANANQEEDEPRSAMLSLSKKALLRSHPSKVRFADGVLVPSPPNTPDSRESCIAQMPNVMRSFLENGQTKAFRYDHTTTVEDVLSSLKDKLGFKSTVHFALVLEYPHGLRRNRRRLLSIEERLFEIPSWRGSKHFRCLLRICFVPADPLELYKKDASAFEYFYQQSVNDVVSGRLVNEMRYEVCIRLASLQMEQINYDAGWVSAQNQSPSKTALKRIEKEYGLKRFLPQILLDNVKLKDIRQHLNFSLRKESLGRSPLKNTLPAFCLSLNGSVTRASEQEVSFLEPSSDRTFSDKLSHVPACAKIRLRYLQILMLLPSFGSQSFCAAVRDTRTDMIMEVHHVKGVLVRHPGRDNNAAILIAYELMSRLRVDVETDVLFVLSFELNTNISWQQQSLEFLLDKDDIEDAVQYIRGYYRLIVGEILPVSRDNTTLHWKLQAPNYYGIHMVRAAGWNYASSLDGYHIADYDQPPPLVQEYGVLSEAVHHVGGHQRNINADENVHQEESTAPRSFLRAKDSLLMGQRRRTEPRNSPLQHYRHPPVDVHRPSLPSVSLSDQPGPDSHIPSSYCQANLSCSSRLKSVAKSCNLEREELEDVMLLFPSEDNVCHCSSSSLAAADAIIDLTTLPSPSPQTPPTDGDESKEKATVAGGSSMAPPAQFRDDELSSRKVSPTLLSVGRKPAEHQELVGFEGVRKSSMENKRSVHFSPHLEKPRRAFSSEQDLMAFIAAKLTAVKSAAPGDRPKLISLTNRTKISAAPQRRNSFTVSRHSPRAARQRKSSQQIPNNSTHAAQTSVGRPSNSFDFGKRGFGCVNSSIDLEAARLSGLSLRDCLQRLGGLRSLQRGIASVELSTGARHSSVAEEVQRCRERKRMSLHARIRSVDALEQSPKKTSLSPKNAPKRRVHGLNLGNAVL